MQRAEFVPIITPRLILRRFQESDLPSLVAYRNDPQIARFQSWVMFSESALRAFIAEQRSGMPFLPNGGFQFALARRADNAHIGDVFVRLLDYDRRQAEVGYTLAANYHGQGYATEAVSALFDEAFRSQGLHRIIALVDTANTPSIAVLERLGMRREAHFLKSYQNRGDWRDEYQYAILHEEWLRRPG